MNIVIYARYSPGSNQSEQSIEGQLKVCREYAERNNYNIIDEYIDRATSGTSDNRPQFKKMIEDSSKKTFQGVLVYQLDRFARNRYDSATYKARLKKNGIRVLSARENISDDASGILMESVLEGMAEYYSVELGQKVKRGMGINADKCYYNGGKIPLGLKLVEAETINGVNGKPIIKMKYAIDEEKAPLIRQVYNMYANGKKMIDIANYLNNQQVKTATGKQFDEKSINRILLNKKYIGIYSYADIEIPNGIPRIIDDVTFDKVCEYMIKNKKNPSRTRAKSEYLLTTKLFCGYCNNMMVGYSGTSKTGKLHNYYRCNGNINKHCDKKMIQKQFIEDLVIDETRKILTYENIKVIATSVVETAEKEFDNSNLKRLNKLLKDNEKQKSNLFDSLKICEIDNVKKSIFEEISKMDNQHKEIEIQILEEESQYIQLTVPQVKHFLTELIKGNSNEEKHRKAIINVLVNKVYVYNNKVIIIFNTQNKPVEIDLSKIKEIEKGLSVKTDGSP